MKRFLSILVIMFVLLTSTCHAGFTYPQYTGDNQKDVKTTERINIVFDNSGHEYVKKMLIDVLSGATIAETSEIWIYPIAGTVKPIKVETNKEFAEDFFNSYAKSSNEFKEENVMEKALYDLKKDTKHKSKRFVLYADYHTSELRDEYGISGSMAPYLNENPDIVFSVFGASGYMQGYNDVVDSSYVYETFSTYDKTFENYDSISSGDFFEFMLVKNGYSLGESSYDKENGVIKIEKGKGDNNIYVCISGYTTNNMLTATGSEKKELPIYLGGCMMDSDTYETYKEKDKVTGVALSYNHMCMESEQAGYVMCSAMFTADGKTINPAEEDLYIPAINANKVLVYHRNTKGSGVCGKNTSYATTQDKKIYNASAPVDTNKTGKDYTNKLTSRSSSKSDKDSDDDRTSESSWSFFGFLRGLMGTIVRIIFLILRLAVLLFVIMLIVNKKFRSYIQIKILDSRFGPGYEKIVKKIKAIITEIAGSGVKIRGDADLKGDFIFISKASADMGLPNNRISLVVKELESRGIKCWLSETGIKPGQDYNVVLPEAIKSCTLFLLFVSPMSVKSSDVISEIGTAKEHKKTIIPVQIEPFDLFKDHPNWAYMLKQYQKTDLFRSKSEEIKALADQIQQTYIELTK